MVVKFSFMQHSFFFQLQYFILQAADAFVAHLHLVSLAPFVLQQVIHGRPDGKHTKTKKQHQVKPASAYTGTISDLNSSRLAFTSISFTAVCTWKASNTSPTNTSAISPNTTFLYCNPFSENKWMAGAECKKYGRENDQRRIVDDQVNQPAQIRQQLHVQSSFLEKRHGVDAVQRKIGHAHVEIQQVKRKRYQQKNQERKSAPAEYIVLLLLADTRTGGLDFV